MNILPKKRWHVRTKENIARVRKDEAEAAENEKQEKLRVENADREARLNLLKQKSKQKLLELGVVDTKVEYTTAVDTHINLFAPFDNDVTSRNKEHDKEVKEKKEEYEKKIGYLTYLGQDTNEALKKKNWYEVMPDDSRFSRSNNIKDTYDKLVLKDEDGKPKENKIDEKDGEVAWKQKQQHDPFNTFKKYCMVTKNMKSSTITNNTDLKLSTKSKNKHKNKYMDNKDKIQKLREARLKREKEEKIKAELFLKGLNGLAPSNNKDESNIKVKAKYNSQFNPELARQNYK